jgi:hypothetical protein
MASIVAVTVLLAGVPVPASRPAWVDARGLIYAPLDPIVTRLARTVEVDRSDGDVVIQQGSRRVVLRIGVDAIAQADGTVYVRLAPVVRGLGGSVTFDAERKVVSIEMPQVAPLTTPTPFQPSNPTVAPTDVFTPQPITTPRPTPTGVPQPRRTPVPVTPSYP